MDRNKALGILKISNCLSEEDIVSKVNEQLGKLHEEDVKEDVTEELPQKIEACKLLTEGHRDQAKVFSDLVTSAIDNDKLDFLALLLKTVKIDDKFDYLNAEGSSGNIPLHFALGYTFNHKSRVRAIDLLLKYGANPNTKNREGKSPLHCIINNRDGIFCHKVTELLLNKDANPNATDGQGKTLLHYLFKDSIHDRVGIMELILNRGANPNIKNERGESLLYEACSKGRDDVVKLLLEHGADPNIKDQEGRSLFYCIINRYSADRYQTIKLLLDKGINPNIQDNQGRTPLHYVCRGHCKKDNVEIVKLLVKRGADPDLKDKDGKKPVDYISYDSDLKKLFGAVDYRKASLLGITTLLATAGSIALISGAADVYMSKVWCTVLASVIATFALCCAYCTIKTMFFSKPSSELIEARSESCNSQKIAGAAQTTPGF